MPGKAFLPSWRSALRDGFTLERDTRRICAATLVRECIGTQPVSRLAISKIPATVKHSDVLTCHLREQILSYDTALRRFS